MTDSTNEKNIQETEDFGAMLEQSLNQANFKLKKGDVVEGKIVSINDSIINISLGLKQDVFAEVGDYLNDGKFEYAIGDTIKGFIVKMSDQEIIISKSLNASHGNKKLLKEAFDKKIPVKGKVTQTVKGGFSVEVLGIRGFCPISQIGFAPSSDMTAYIGNTYDFEIIEFERNNIILSRKAFAQKTNDDKRTKRLEEIEIGNIIDGKVARLASFGAFIDIDGIEGLLHISEFSWERIEKPEDMLHIGDEVQVQVIRREGDKVSLSMRAIQTNPMTAAIEEIHEGDIVNCKILRHEKFGSFVEIKPGVEGLIPLSLMSSRRIKHPSDVLELDSTVEAKIVRVDKATQKISLSIRDLEPNPWESIEHLYQENQEVEGTIESVNAHGAFIKLSEGIVGLLPKSKIARAQLKLSPKSIGTTLAVKITQIDLDNRRISLEPLNMPEWDESKAPAPREQKDHREQRDSKPRRERKSFEPKSDKEEEWKKYNSSYQGVPEDNPFSKL